MAFAAAVNQPRDDLFPDSALARDEDFGLGSPGAVDIALEVADRSTATQELMGRARHLIDCNPTQWGSPSLWHDGAMRSLPGRAEHK
jgi:hypothetical protein